MPESKHPTQRRYPPELKERASRMVLEAFQHTGDRHGVVTRVAQQLGIGPESLRQWVKQAEVDTGRRAGTTTEDKLRIAQLDAREPRAAPCQRDPQVRVGFFARELDPRLPR